MTASASDPDQTRSPGHKPITLRRIALTLLVAILALILSDPLVGLLARNFVREPAILVNDFPSTWGLDLFWQLTASGQKPIVFTGSSTVYYAVSPHVFDAKVKKLTGVEPVSLISGATGEIASWARDLIKNIFIPRGAAAIIYATEMRAYAERDSDASWQTSALGYSMQYPEGWRKEIALWLLEHSSYVRYRNNFHDLITARRKMDQRFGSFDPLDDRGHSASSEEQDPNSPMPVPNPWTPLIIELAQRDALAEIAQRCKAGKTVCVFVILPVDPTLFNVIPEAERLEFRQFVKDQASQGQATVWDFNNLDCVAALGNSPFRDHDHLNDNGSQQFSTLLAIRYAHDFYNRPIPANSGADCAVEP